MTIMTITVPDDVKEAFDRAFEGEDKNAILAQLIQRAVSEKKSSINDMKVTPLVERFREFRKGLPEVSQEEIREIREQLRREAGY